MLVAIMAIALAFNILVIYWKFTHDRHADAILDSSALIAIAYVFGGSSQNLMIGTMASAIISIYFLIFPPTATNSKQEEMSL